MRNRRFRQSNLLARTTPFPGWPPNVDHFAQSVPFAKVAANDYNLSVSSYVEARDNREVVDIAQLNAELKTTVARIDKLRAEIDAIVAEIEGEQA
jgi:type I restriction enzyme M protein